jgi:hypothetical protein
MDWEGKFPCGEGQPAAPYILWIACPLTIKNLIAQVEGSKFSNIWHRIVAFLCTEAK